MKKRKKNRVVVCIFDNLMHVTHFAYLPTGKLCLWGNFCDVNVGILTEFSLLLSPI